MFMFSRPVHCPAIAQSQWGSRGGSSVSWNMRADCFALSLQVTLPGCCTTPMVSLRISLGSLQRRRALL